MARIGRNSAGHDAKQRGLAGTIRPDDAERLALLKREIKLIRNDDGAKAFGDVMEFQDG
jgi:hypothetical protein